MPIDTRHPLSNDGFWITLQADINQSNIVPDIRIRNAKFVRGVRIAWILVRHTACCEVVQGIVVGSTLVTSQK
jgi:hypothetical protein